MTFYGFGFRPRTHFLSSRTIFFYFTCFHGTNGVFVLGVSQKKWKRRENFVCNMHHNYEPWNLKPHVRSFFSFVHNYRSEEPKEHETLFKRSPRTEESCFLFLGSFSMEKSKFSRSNDSPVFFERSCWWSQIHENTDYIAYASPYKWRRQKHRKIGH